jgi:hypothetical protein
MIVHINEENQDPEERADAGIRPYTRKHFLFLLPAIGKGIKRLGKEKPFVLMSV